MKIEISISDDQINNVIESIESLVGQAHIMLSLKTVNRGGVDKREYLKANLRYIVKEFLRSAGEHKEKKLYENRLSSVLPPQQVTTPEVDVL